MSCLIRVRIERKIQFLTIKMKKLEPVLDYRKDKRQKNNLFDL
jgi:hypothetical protein